jgi:hypothetical protein
MTANTGAFLDFPVIAKTRLPRFSLETRLEQIDSEDLICLSAGMVMALLQPFVSAH